MNYQLIRLFFTLLTIIYSSNTFASNNFNDYIKAANALKLNFELLEDTEGRPLRKIYKPLAQLDLLLETSYVRPNERSPEKAKKILFEAPEGVYVSVGTERGFIGASMAMNTTHLVLVDYDLNVNLFNQLNIFLLKIAVDLNDYRYLRNNADHDYIIKRAHIHGISDAELGFISNQNVFYFLKHIVRNPFFLRPISIWALNSSIANKTHYLKDQTLFNRIHKLAKEDKISVLQINLNDSNSIEILSSHIEKLPHPLSVLDISNAWWGDHKNPRTGKNIFGYMQREQLGQMLLKMGRFANENSLLLITNLDERFKPLKMVWDFYGFKISKVIELIKQNRISEIFTDYNKLNSFSAGKLNDLNSDPLLSNKCLWFYR